MASIPIKIKHQGKVYEVDADPESTGEDFMLQLYSLTNVEPAHQKIMISPKITNETILSRYKFKPGQTILLVGQPSADVVVQAPEHKTKFLEDMSEAERARQEGAIPAGLGNTGNTCYANASLQTLRLIPELQEHLNKYKPSRTATATDSSLFSPEQLAQFGLGGRGGANDLTGSLRDLYKTMGQTQEAVPPILFLTALRQKFPQFGERARNGHGYAQQDAEEMWSQLIQTLQQDLKITKSGEAEPRFDNFVSQYMGGRLDSVTKSEEAPDEKEVHNTEDFTSLKCNIASDTNHLREGLAISLNESFEKTSETLGREAVYTKTSRIARLPKYLPIHFLRFFWRKDSQKKAKILRKVTFQHEIDLLEFCTDELRAKLIPIRDKIRDIRKEEEDVERAKKRQKRMKQEQADAEQVGGKIATNEPLQKKKEKEKKQADSGDAKMEDAETFKTDAEIEQERADAIFAAKKELLSLVDPSMAEDPTANQTGLYELRGVVTHQGASADSGHYTAYVKKAAADGKAEDGKWWWFNDDKVSEVDQEKIETLSGGGETHSALILLYRAVPLPTLEEKSA